jgi:GNAT superfamily N-acetyltransferase
VTCDHADVLQPATNPESDLLAAALEFQRGTLERTADRMWAIDGGRVALTPSLPTVYIANTVELTGRVTYHQAVAVTEEQMRDLPYRQLTIDDAATARQLEPSFVADGWTVDRDLVMALARPLDREVDTADVRECDEREISRLMAEWISKKPSIERHEVDQVVEFTRREARARNARELGVLADDGAVVAITKLYSDGTIAQVEDVYTSPAWRGRGYSRALIARAIAIAQDGGHELVFTCADDEGWPKQLYAKLGFDPVGRIMRFHRDVG